MSDVRVRFAPSPTGYLHVGGARTALYNYLFAKHHGGKFILRVEDTDEARSTEEFIKMQMDDLKWLGLDWDEGLEYQTLKDFGPYGPYRQSKRLDIYKKYADQLMESGRAYYCFLSDAEIEVQRQAAMKSGRPPQVNSPYRNWTKEKALEKIAKGDKPVVRFKVKDEEKRDYNLKDLVRGDVRFPSDMVGDFVLLRASGMPVYNFCCVIDDALMKISHVFRAEEHLSNTLRQMMIYDELGFQMPEFGHMSVILGSDKQKLSKRHGAASCNEYRQNGFLPDALLNFVALLGWSSPKAQEILSRQEMIEQFNYDRLHSAPAVFDPVKLNWVNSQHLRALPEEELWKLVEPFLNEAGLKLPEDMPWRLRALSVYKTGMNTLKDAVEAFRPLSETPIDISSPEAQEVFSWPSTKVVVEAWRKGVEQSSSDYMSEEQFNTLQDKIKDEQNVKGKHLFQPIRVAIIGKPHGTELKMLVPLLHKKTLVSRAENVLSQIKG
jgi:nondiscriminating glutamyl-tRNA synthetase